MTENKKKTVNGYGKIQGTREMWLLGALWVTGMRE